MKLVGVQITSGSGRKAGTVAWRAALPFHTVFLGVTVRDRILS